MQQDYLLRQFEQFGKVLAKILSKLLGVDSQSGAIVVQIEQQFAREKLDLDIRELIGMGAEEVIDTLKNHKGLTNEDLEKVTDILLLAANDETDIAGKEAQEKKCLAIYEYIQANNACYSFSLFSKIENLKQSN